MKLLECLITSELSALHTYNYTYGIDVGLHFQMYKYIATLHHFYLHEPLLLIFT